MSCMVSPDPDKDKDKKDKQYCEICAEAGFKKEAIRRLYNGRSINIVDFDTGQKHYHKFNQPKWDWDHYGQ